MVLLGKLLWQKGWEERAVLPCLLSNVTMLELGWCTSPKEEALEKSCGAGEADGISPTAFVHGVGVGWRGATLLLFTYQLR